MVDIETMGVSSNAAIVSIGAVHFDPHWGMLGKEFYVPVSLKDSSKYGTMDADTILWWLQQNEAAREQLTKSDGMNLEQALSLLVTFIRGAHQGLLRLEEIYVWGHGATFDPVVLDNAYKAVKLQTPWTFRNVRDTRTLFDFVGGAPVVALEDIEHHALYDARKQALQVQAAYRLLSR